MAYHDKVPSKGSGALKHRFDAPTGGAYPLHIKPNAVIGNLQLQLPASLVSADRDLYPARLGMFGGIRE